MAAPYARAVFLGCGGHAGARGAGRDARPATHTDWLAHTALVLFWLGLLLYTMALFYFDYREVATGAGDQWVAGGALAISALAGSKLILAYQANIYLWNDDDNGVLRWVTEALLVLVLGTYCVLAVAEALWPDRATTCCAGRPCSRSG